MIEMELENVESLGVRNFLAARIQEINSLSQQISSTGVPSSKGLAFQHVPKHLRRRAVSHNPKRLPKRLQGIHRSQVEKSSGGGGGGVKKPKKPSRKHRRRPSNLLEEYNRRQRENKWLETHIWHAKRFHMHNKWGYRMPIEPTGKGYRAGYRAATKFAAMRDISFYSCLQLQGDPALISSTIMDSFAPRDVNPLGVGSEMFKNGKREGSLHFYRGHTYPFGYVGRVWFHWNMDQSSLFIWVHPAQKDEIVIQISSEFELMSKHKLFRKDVNKIEEEDVAMDEECSDEVGVSEEIIQDKNNVKSDRDKLRPKKLDDRPKWINYTSNVILTDLEGVFNRFRLYGPLATQTLKEVFKVLSPTKLTEAAEFSSNQFWWLQYYADKLSVLTKQCELWDSLVSFEQIPCHSIIPLTLNDPRVSIPKQQEPVVTKNNIVKPILNYDDINDLRNMVDELQMTAADCPLLNEKVRMRAINERMSQEEFNKRQSKLLIPGSKLNLGPEENQVPILLVHRPCSGSRGFKNGGWDLILPAGWAMSFWIALVYRSVRVVGLRESETFEFESGSSINSNEDGFIAPDSFSGETEADTQSAALRINYFKYPPAKRPSFIKLGCPFPFKIDWKMLLKFNQHSISFNVDVDSFYVLRNPKVLKQLSKCVSSQKHDATINDDFITDLPYSESVLIGIRLTIVGKGSIGIGSVICMPQELDIVQRDKCTNKCTNLEEPLFDDSDAQQKRDKLRNERDRMKSFMQKKRQKLRKQQINGKPADLSPFCSSDRLRTFNETIDSLWLPDSEQVLTKMTRTPFGFVIFGRESYCIAKCSGIGYCTFSSLKQWLISKCWNPQKLVLVRDCRNSTAYRFAKLEICV